MSIYIQCTHVSGNGLGFFIDLFCTLFRASVSKEADKFENINQSYFCYIIGKIT